MNYSFRDDRLPYMSGDEWHNFLDNIDSPAIVKLEEELEKNDIELIVDGTKDGSLYINKYTYSTNESYTPYKGRISTNKINFMANIARMNGIETTNRLRDDIVSEYTNILESLDTINESIIVKDISLLPVYKINEGLFSKNPYKDIIKEYKRKYSIEKYDYKKIYKSTQLKVITELSKHLKSVNGIKLEGDECSEKLSGSIHIYTDRLCKASEQAKIDELLMNYKFSKSYSPVVNGDVTENRHIALIDDSIISVYFEYSYDLALRERKYSNDVTFKIIYSKGDAKEIGIPAKVIYDIMSEFKLKDLSIIYKTQAYVFIGEIPKNKSKKIANSIHYKTYVNALGGIYIFNPKIVKNINESYIEDDVLNIDEESLDNFFIEEETEIINESLSGDYQNIMSFNIGFLGRKIYSIKMLKRMKGSLEKKLNKYEIKLKEFKKMNDDEKAKFCFKINAGNAARSAAIAAGTTAVSQYASDGNYSLTYIELPDKITPYNYPGIAEKMIRKLKSDIQNIDKLIKQKEKAKRIKEGYAIDLDSLKYVVEYKKLTLEEAVQEIKDVNYIGDTYPMYCVIPEDVNENMTLESFIDLNESLINSNIIPMAINELSKKEWDRSNG